MQKRGYLVIFVLLIISMFIIVGCKEGAVGGNIGSKKVYTNTTAAGLVNYGDLVIGSNVLGADLYVDGVYQSGLTAQNTPFAIKGSKFNTATHLVEVKKEGYEDYSRTVTLRPRQQVIVNAELNIVVAKPVVGECVDTDGGENYVISGNTTEANGINWTDLCVRDYPPFKEGVYVLPSRLTENGGLLEGKCGLDVNGNTFGYVFDYECPNGCKDGACISSLSSCTDSDGGLNYYVNGTTSGVSPNGSPWVKIDYCDANTVNEYNCDGNEPGNGGSLLCPNGCKDGACISNQTATNSEQLEQLLRNGEYLFFDNGRLKVSCNSIRGSQSAFSNNTQIYPNGSISGFAEHYLIAGENVFISGKKISCN